MVKHQWIKNTYTNRPGAKCTHTFLVAYQKYVRNEGGLKTCYTLARMNDRFFETLDGEILYPSNVDYYMILDPEVRDPYTK